MWATTVKKTITHLADGRELIYFDERDDAARPTVDPRHLLQRPVPAEVRYDVLADEWVVIAAHRQDRTHLPPSDECPLCPSRAGRTTEIPADDYDVVVFENRFPSLSERALPVPPLVDPPGAGEGLRAAEGGAGGGAEPLFRRQPSVGRCEVVCFTADHDASFAALTPARARTVVEAWVDRTVELGRVQGVEQVFCFENRGEAIGVTLHHPHGQIYAYPFVTPRTRHMLDAARRYRERTWRNLFADVLAEEQRAGVRVVRRTEHWTAFVPAAARWPVELRLFPNRQVPDLPALSDAERDDFCRLYLDLLGRLDRLHGAPLPYVAAWHQAPVRIDRDLAYLHLEVLSVQRAPAKLKYLAGSESGMGVFINDVAPEDCARWLREHGASPPP
jgi:UDPglucose--hexose-1-phosphate uridylyltransferase